MATVLPKHALINLILAPLSFSLSTPSAYISPLNLPISFYHPHGPSGLHSLSLCVGLPRAQSEGPFVKPWPPQPLPLILGLAFVCSCVCVCVCVLVLFIGWLSGVLGDLVQFRDSGGRDWRERPVSRFLQERASDQNWDSTVRHLQRGIHDLHVSLFRSLSLSL